MNNDLHKASRLNTQNFLEKILTFLFHSCSCPPYKSMFEDHQTGNFRLFSSRHLPIAWFPEKSRHKRLPLPGQCGMCIICCGVFELQFLLCQMKLWLYSHLPNLSLKQQTQMSDLIKSDRWLMFNQFVMQCNASLSELGCHCLFLIGF